MHVPIASRNATSARLDKQPQDPGTYVGYCLVEQSEDGSFSGGLLVVTHKGCPVAFHYTRPICPDQVQRILYGAQLEEAVAGDLITASLVSATKQKLACLLVSRPACLVVRPATGFPVGCPAALGAPSTSSKHLARVTVAGTAWYVHSDFERDAATLAEMVDRMGGIDVALEPFQRVRLALDHIHQRAA